MGERFEGEFAELLRHKADEALEVAKDGRDPLDVGVDGVDVLSLRSAIPVIFGFKHYFEDGVEHSVEVRVGLVGPYVAMVLN